MIALNLVPWPQLTRTGIPQFLVARRPLLIEGREYPVGVQLPPSLIPSRVRMRQMYEQRRIEPVEAHKRSVRAMNEAAKTKAKLPTPTPEPATDIGLFDQNGFESLDLPHAEVTELDEQPTPVEIKKKAFQPRRGGRVVRK